MSRSDHDPVLFFTRRAQRRADLIDRFEDAWNAGERPDLTKFLPEDDDQRRQVLTELAAVELELRLKAGQRARVEEYLARFPEVSVEPAFVRGLVAAEFAVRRLAEPVLSPADYFERFPQFQPALTSVFHEQTWPSTRRTRRSACPNCQRPVELADDGSTQACPHCDSTLSVQHHGAAPPSARGAEVAVGSSLGDFQLLEEVGAGNFGSVYKAHDRKLDRTVALKIPRGDWLHSREAVDAFLHEAQHVARLTHPGIVRLYQFGEDDCCYVVYEFIEGTSLRAEMRHKPFSPRETARLLTDVAAALDYAHQEGIFHRDIKPENILLDRDGRPYLADFGIAVRADELAHQQGWLAGTYPYMSPEVLRGEGHRIDARSDIYSLGIVMYEMLSGRRPFAADTREELIEQILHAEPTPLDLSGDSVMLECARICRKAMARRAADRYTTAGHMAEDLRAVQREAATSAPGGQQKITPHGLRPFEPADAHFFLRLIPGPVDRDGLPESLRFWKLRIEETNADDTFDVGLIYGPSGCGKSSLVRAGLIPRLARHVTAIYVEATRDQTAQRLRGELFKRFPSLPRETDLAGQLAAIRRDPKITGGKKVVIFLDQFEQWLHAQDDTQSDTLAAALRQCDASGVQCVLLVRDDFWMAVTRFMRYLEAPIIEGQNSAAVDLFDLSHARRVLAEFGRAYERLPDAATPLSARQEAFLDQAVSGLAEAETVVPIRLAVLAEMIKHKPWEPATWKSLGGERGIVAAFLEETFSASTTTPALRRHVDPARRVLQALLPEHGGNIKGQIRSHAELLAASRYDHRSNQFDALLAQLEEQLRLITPTEAADSAAVAPSNERQDGGADRYYQLTHDYLVQPLRDWLTRKQRETRRGRAGLRLAEHAAEWNARRQRRYLPSLWKWVNIVLFTRRRDRTAAERAMLRQATKYHVMKWGTAAIVMLVATWSGAETYGRRRADFLINELLRTRTATAPRIVDELQPYRRWAEPKLRERLGRDELSARADLHIRLALVPHDPQQLTYFEDRLNEAVADNSEDVEQFTCIVTVLSRNAPHYRSRLIDHLLQGNMRQFRIIMSVLSDSGMASADDLWSRLALTAKSISEPGATEGLIRRRAHCIAALFRLGHPQPLWDAWGEDGNSQVKSYLVNNLHAADANLSRLVDQLYKATDESQRRALLLALGSYEKPNAITLPKVRLENVVNHVSELYRTSTDSGTHSAAGWLLKRWGRKTDDQERDQALAASKSPRPDQRWYGTSCGHTLAVIPKGTVYQFGSPESEPNRTPQEDLTRRQLGYSFAIGTHEITVGQFAQFDDSKNPQQGRPFSRPDDGTNSENEKVAAVKTPDYFENLPQGGINWHQAAAYCNWLSQREGITEDQWVYRRAEPAGDDRTPHLEMREHDDWHRRTGYRLPTEQEWECACRAGSTTSRFYGNSEPLLSHYGWYAASFTSNVEARLQPVGLLKPNDFGLFDVYGNVVEWCHAVTDPLRNPDNLRPLRGGALDFARALRSASREYGPAHVDPASPVLGFRIARRMP